MDSGLASDINCLAVEPETLTLDYLWGFSIFNPLVDHSGKRAMAQLCALSQLMHKEAQKLLERRQQQRRMPTYDPFSASD